MEEAIGMHGTAPLRKSQAKLPGGLGERLLPDGRTVDMVDAGELRRVCMARDIPGASPTDGKLALAECYARFLDDIGQRAAEQAIASWLRASR